MNALTSISIGDTIIRQTTANQYCINDLHKAAGALSKNQPSKFLLLDSTKELIAEINKDQNLVLEQNQAVKVINGGNRQGTYVVKELVYAYAMWISPKFSLQVIRAYDALATQPDPDDELTSYHLHSDGQYRLERPTLAQGYAIPAPQANARPRAIKQEILDSYNAHKNSEAAQQIADLQQELLIAKASQTLHADYLSLQNKYIALLEKQAQAPAPLPFGAPRTWTPDEDAILFARKAQGIGDTRIGRELGRSCHSVTHRRRQLAKRQGGAA